MIYIVRQDFLGLIPITKLPIWLDPNAYEALSFFKDHEIDEVSYMCVIPDGTVQAGDRYAIQLDKNTTSVYDRYPVR